MKTTKLRQVVCVPVSFDMHVRRKRVRLLVNGNTLWTLVNTLRRYVWKNAGKIWFSVVEMHHLLIFRFHGVILEGHIAKLKDSYEKQALQNVKVELIQKAQDLCCRSYKCIGRYQICGCRDYSFRILPSGELLGRLRRKNKKLFQCFMFTANPKSPAPI